MPGAYQPKAFLKDNELDGIHASVIYPSVGLIFFKRPNSPLLRAIFQAYNDWIAEFCSEDPNRLRGVAMILLDDIEESVKELERCHRMGLAAAQIPTYPEPHRPYDAELYEPFWEAAEALRMPLGLHIQSWRPQPVYGQMGPALGPAARGCTVYRRAGGWCGRTDGCRRNRPPGQRRLQAD